MDFERKSFLANIDYKEILSFFLIFLALAVVVLQLTDRVDINKFTAEVYNNLAFLLPGASSKTEELFEESAIFNINLEALEKNNAEMEAEVSQGVNLQEKVGKKENPVQKSQTEQMRDKVKELRNEITVLQLELNQTQKRVNGLQERINQLQS